MLRHRQCFECNTKHSWGLSLLPYYILGYESLQNMEVFLSLAVLSSAEPHRSHVGVPWVFQLLNLQMSQHPFNYLLNKETLIKEHVLQFRKE